MGGILLSHSGTVGNVDFAVSFHITDLTLHIAVSGSVIWVCLVGPVRRRAGAGYSPVKVTLSFTVKPIHSHSPEQVLKNLRRNTGYLMSRERNDIHKTKTRLLPFVTCSEPLSYI